MYTLSLWVVHEGSLPNNSQQSFSFSQAILVSRSLCSPIRLDSLQGSRSVCSTRLQHFSTAVGCKSSPVQIPLYSSSGSSNRMVHRKQVSAHLHSLPISSNIKLSQNKQMKSWRIWKDEYIEPLTSEFHAYWMLLPFRQKESIRVWWFYCGYFQAN